MSRLHLSMLPDDLILEIAAHLPASDLLPYCRISHIIRQVILSRSSRQIWARSLAAVPLLPEKPEDLSEPAYASLMFETLCSHCGVVEAEIRLFSLRKRYCRGCFERHSDLVSGEEVIAQVGDQIYHQFVLPWSIVVSVQRPLSKSALYPGIYLDKPHVNSVIDAIWGKWNAAEREVLHRGSRLLTRESANVMPAVLPDEVKENLKRWWLADGAAPLLEQWIIKSAWAKDRKVSELQRGQFTRLSEPLRASGWGEEVDYLQTYGGRGHWSFLMHSISGPHGKEEDKQSSMLKTVKSIRVWLDARKQFHRSQGS